ncbi:MAG TPA: MauE/DoxX family redox-associated membrane protein [Bryobacteraceae bacterium]
MAFSNKYLRWLALMLRIVLGAIFVYAAWVKLRDPWELYALAISSYEVLPLWAVELVARTLPWLELAVGVGLIAGIWLRLSSTVTSLLLTVFFVLMVRAFSKGMQINCGCFGGTDIISKWTLLRDGSMLAGSLLLTSMAFSRQRRAA